MVPRQGAGAAMRGPPAEDAANDYTLGLDLDLNTAMKTAVQETVEFLREKGGASAAEAYAIGSRGVPRSSPAPRPSFLDRGQRLVRGDLHRLGIEAHPRGRVVRPLQQQLLDAEREAVGRLGEVVLHRQDESPRLVLGVLDHREGGVSQHLQHWDADNLFVVGASVFPHNSGYNPTGVLAALALRLGDDLTSYVERPRRL